MIVSDATVLITLMNIDEFEVLSLFVNHIIITPEVYDEVTQQTVSKMYIDKQKDKGFINIKSYEDTALFEAFSYVLDAGESASIALAVETKLPLIIDEKKGRKFAQMQGVKIIGLVGILKYLYKNKILSEEKIRSIIRKLNASDFRISSTLLMLILE